MNARLPEAFQWLLVPHQPTPQSPIEWQSFRLSGQEPLAVRASRKLRNDELLITGLAATRLRLELDQVPLWRGDHVAVKQLVEDFARYLYLPRLRDTGVLLDAIREGLGLLTWGRDSFAYAESYDEAASRYRGLRCGQMVSLSPENLIGLLVKPEPALKQQDDETPRPTAGGAPTGGDPAKPNGDTSTITGEESVTGGGEAQTPRQPRRFHGSVTLDAARVGRDASRVAEEVIAHLSGLMGANVKVTLEIEAEIPNGAPDNVVRTVTENSRTLKFNSQGFEKD